MLHGMFLAWEAYTHSWCFSTVLSSWLIPVYRFCILMIYEFVKGKQNCLGFLGNAVLGTPGLIRGLISLLSESLNPFNFPERQNKNDCEVLSRAHYRKKRVLLDDHKTYKAQQQTQNKMVHKFSVNLHSRLVSAREAILRHASLQMWL